MIYTYEDGRLIRAAESDITLNGDIVTAKKLVNSILYTYDFEGKLTKKRIIPADGTEQAVYYENPENENAVVVKFTAGGRTVTSHSKTDSFGRKVFDELQLGTGFVSRQFHYHSGNITEEHKANSKIKSSPTTQLVSQIVLSGGRTISYEYDAEERITKVTDSVDGTYEYTYDALGQLLTEKHEGVVVNSMEYDNYGNILSKNGIAYTYGDAKWKDLLTKVGDKTISYDKQGNPTSYLGHTLKWEKGRQLRSFDSNTYTYNAAGIRTSKTVNGVKHIYTLDGTKILRETWDGNTLIPMYDNGESICGIVFNDVPYYFQKNLQGDIVSITDSNAEVVATYSYDAWGVCTITNDISGVTISNINPFRYRGYYFDIDTNLYYLQSRYYNPMIGRFLNADEAIYLRYTKTLYFKNIFAYCENDVLNSVDRDGRRRIAIFYDSRTSGYLWGYVGGVGFNKQANIWINKLKERGNSVEEYPFQTITKLCQSWNGTSGSFDDIIIFSHGSPGALDCNGHRLVVGIMERSEKYTLHRPVSLKFISSKFVYIFACNAGTLYKGEDSIARLFAFKTHGDVFAVKDSAVNIDYSSGMVSKANDSGVWIRVKYNKSRCSYSTTSYPNMYNLSPTTYF